MDSPTATEDEQRKGVGVVVDHINSRGGIGGKRIEMVFHFVDVSSGTHDSRGAESCAFFTEDNEVFGRLDGRPTSSRGRVTDTCKLSSDPGSDGPSQYC